MALNKVRPGPLLRRPPRKSALRALLLLCAVGLITGAGSVGGAVSRKREAAGRVQKSSPTEAPQSVPSGGAAGERRTDESDAIRSALHSLKTGTLILPAGAYHLRTSLTIPKTSRLQAEPGARIWVDAGVTLRVEGGIVADRRLLFEPDEGARLIVPHTPLFPEWFGAVADGLHDDAPALNRCLAILKASGGGVLDLAPGKTYLLNRSVNTGTSQEFSDNITLNGHNATLQNNSPSVPRSARFNTLRAMGGHVTIRDLNLTWTRRFDPNRETFDEVGDGRWAPSALAAGGYPPALRENILIDNVRVVGAWYAGIRVTYASHVMIRNCQVERALGTGIFPAGIRADLTVENCRVRETGDAGIYVETGYGLTATRGAKLLNNRVEKSYRGSGIGMGGVWLGLIRGNTVTQTWGYGIHLDAGAPAGSRFSEEGTRRIQILENVITDAGQYYRADTVAPGPNPVASGINAVTETTLDLIGEVEIRNNRIIRPYNDGITISGVRGLKIEGNLIEDARTGNGNGINVGNVHQGQALEWWRAQAKMAAGARVKLREGGALQALTSGVTGDQEPEIEGRRVGEAVADGSLRWVYEAETPAINVRDFQIVHNTVRNVRSNGIIVSFASNGTLSGNQVSSYGWREDPEAPDVGRKPAKNLPPVNRGILLYMCSRVEGDDNTVLNDRGAQEFVNYAGSVHSLLRNTTQRGSPPDAKPDTQEKRAP